jgi:hypothetical protein
MPLTVNWAAVPVTGGLTYWSSMSNPPVSTGHIATPPNYVELDGGGAVGTVVERYDFSQANALPAIVWTDDGGPGSTPAYLGAPQAWVGGAASGHCIGCHAMSNDGKYMAVTIGGSSTFGAANWALLDVQNQALFLVNPTRTGGNGCNDPSASPTNDPVCYWEQYRLDGFAAESAWGPNDDAMVNMYKSQLYLSTVTIDGGTATATRQRPAFPATAPDPYASDPFWSADGSLVAFTRRRRGARRRQRRWHAGLRQLVPPLRTGRGAVPRQDALLGGLLLAPPLRTTGERHADAPRDLAAALAGGRRRGGDDRGRSQLRARLAPGAERRAGDPERQPHAAVGEGRRHDQLILGRA